MNEDASGLQENPKEAEYPQPALSELQSAELVSSESIIVYPTELCPENDVLG